MAGSKKLTAPIPRHRILREVYRHFTEFKAIVAATGESVFEHGYFIYDKEGNVVDREMVTISFWDLHDALKELSDRKREAVFYNVILDRKQRDVAKEMGITTVSVGQYVDQAFLQLAERYFADDETTRRESFDRDRSGQKVLA
jgi:DNA-directed RNA polymerase specialized sigma24 family protein